MGAWNFKKELAGKVEQGKKITTIRARRKDSRDPVVGEKMSLFTGMRRKVCRRLANVVITRRLPIQIFKKNGGFVFNTIHNLQAGVPIENVAAMMDVYKENCARA